MKILNIGSLNVDHVYSLDHIVRDGETETTDKLEIFSGGKGLNQSIAAARAGARVFHAGCIGADGAFLKEALSESGVDTSLIKTVDAPCGHAIIQVSKKGENSIFLYPGSNRMLTADYIDNVLEGFSSGDTVLLQNETNLTGYIVEQAYKKGMTTVFNPSPMDEKIKEVDFNKLTYVILNEVEAKAITGCSESSGILEYFKKRYPQLKVMLTLGVNGSVYLENGSTVFQIAYKANAVDTTAAGDTFTGYFVKGITENGNIGEILSVAAMAASIAVSRMGAAPSIPVYAEVLDALKAGEII